MLAIAIAGLGSGHMTGESGFDLYGDPMGIAANGYPNRTPCLTTLVVCEKKKKKNSQTQIIHISQTQTPEPEPEISRTKREKRRSTVVYGLCGHCHC
jgi:hypothetical protein